MQTITAPKVSFSPEDLSALLATEGLPNALASRISAQGFSLEAADSKLLKSALMVGTLMARNSKQMLVEAAENGSAEARRILKAYCGDLVAYAGTFDPFTRGHRDLVERLLKIYGEIVVAVGTNRSKTPIFAPEERVKLIKEDLKEFGNRVKVVPYSGTLVEVCDRNNIQVVFRGVRNITDFDQELTLTRFNFDHSDERVETVMMAAREGGSYVSSSFVKEMVTLGRSVSSYLSPHIEKALKERMKMPDLLGTAPVSTELKKLIPILEEKWFEVTAEFQAGEQEKENAFNKTLNRWCSAKRSYHTLRHIYEMICWIEANCPTEYQGLLILGAFGHDAILDPSRKDNEDRSASWFSELLSGLGASKATEESVSKLILATKKHAFSGNPLIDWFLTADLMILATPRARYMEYACGVAQEYLSAVDEAAYIAGRSSFLDGMSQRKTIFPLLPGSDERDKAARENMQFELQILKECPGLIVGKR